jgi:1,4-dihydroxy-2-naphthoyl-CoA hydrolase
VNDFDKAAAASLPGLLGLEFVETRRGFVRARMDIKPHHLAPNGYLHAASVIALADSACGRGCIASLPEGATSFTTIELKANFLGTALDGAAVTQARLAHGGRTTQVWDATVMREKDEKQIALFHCTQLILYPK